MWTATVKNKDATTGIMHVSVDFSNGVKTLTEVCIPQDKDGFDHWVKSRLATLNSATVIDSVYAVGSPVVIADPVVATPTAAEIARNEWFNDFRKLQQAQKLVDLGVILTTNAKIVALRDRLKTNLRVEYIDAL